MLQSGEMGIRMVGQRLQLASNRHEKTTSPEAIGPDGIQVDGIVGVVCVVTGCPERSVVRVNHVLVNALSEWNRRPERPVEGSSPS